MDWRQYIIFEPGKRSGQPCIRGMRMTVYDVLEIITDGWCDVVRVRREHAYLIPEGRNLPFVPRGKVFRMR
jgi:hypothetical protein